LRDFEFHFLTFLQRLEPVHLNGREVRKQIFAAQIGGDEAESLRVVEPLDDTGCLKNPSVNCTTYTLSTRETWRTASKIRGRNRTNPGSFGPLRMQDIVNIILAIKRDVPDKHQEAVT